MYNVSYHPTIAELPPPLPEMQSDNQMLDSSTVDQAIASMPTRYFRITTKCWFWNRWWYLCAAEDDNLPKVWWTQWWQDNAPTWSTWKDWFGTGDYHVLTNQFIQGRWWAKCISASDFPLVSWWTKYWHRDGSFHWSHASEWPNFEPTEHDDRGFHNTDPGPDLAQQQFDQMLQEINAMNIA